MSQGFARSVQVNASIAGMAVAALMLSACGQGNQYVPPPLPKVTVAVPAQQPMTRYLEATGNLAAVNSADLVARVQASSIRSTTETARG